MAFKLVTRRGVTFSLAQTYALSVHSGLVFRANSLVCVRLLKIDCEGAEYQIIMGGRQALAQQTIDFIALEYHPAICGIEKCLQIHEALRAAGYQLTKTHGQHIYKFGAGKPRF